MWPLIGNHAPVEDEVFKDVWGAQNTVDGLYFKEYKQLGGQRCIWEELGEEADYDQNVFYDASSSSRDKAWSHCQEPTECPTS